MPHLTIHEKIHQSMRNAIKNLQFWLIFQNQEINPLDYRL
jgi:hypothetical protein